jgi:tetratricopeptide (TPR) repeat protein
VIRAAFYIWRAPRNIGRVLRLLGFLVAVIVLLNLLKAVPGIGGWFHGLLGFWLVAILLAIALSRATEKLQRVRRFASQLHALGHVESPHNHGKLGSLLSANGRPAAALPHLERACAGEPEVAEWRFRRGLALLALGRAPDAITALESAAAIDEEHAYGGVQLALARAHSEARNADAALGALDRFDRNHGPNPESAFRRGLALKLAGRANEAREALAQVGELARRAARFQRPQNRRWVLRAWLARWMPAG